MPGSQVPDLSARGATDCLERARAVCRIWKALQLPKKPLACFAFNAMIAWSSSQSDLSAIRQARRADEHNLSYLGPSRDSERTWDRLQGLLFDVNSAGLPVEGERKVQSQSDGGSTLTGRMSCQGGGQQSCPGLFQPELQQRGVAGSQSASGASAAPSRIAANIRDAAVEFSRGRLHATTKAAIRASVEDQYLPGSD